MDGEERDVRKHRRRSMRNIRRRSEVLPFDLENTIQSEEKKVPEKDKHVSGAGQEDVYGSLWMETNEPIVRRKKRRSSLFFGMSQPPLVETKDDDNIAETVDLYAVSSINPKLSDSQNTGVNIGQFTSSDLSENLICSGDQNIKKEQEIESFTDLCFPVTKPGDSCGHTALDTVNKGQPSPKHTKECVSPSNLETNESVTPPNLDRVCTPSSMSPEYPESHVDIYQNTADGSFLTSSCDVFKDQPKESLETENVDCTLSPSPASNRENSFDEINQQTLPTSSEADKENLKVTVDEKGENTSPGIYSISRAIGKVVDFVKTSPSYLFGMISDNSSTELSASPALKPIVKENVMASPKLSVGNLFTGLARNEITVCVNGSSESPPPPKSASPAKEKNEVFFGTYKSIMRVFQKTQRKSSSEPETHHGQQPETRSDCKVVEPSTSSQQPTKKENFHGGNLDKSTELNDEGIQQYTDKSTELNNEGMEQYTAPHSEQGTDRLDNDTQVAVKNENNLNEPDLLVSKIEMATQENVVKNCTEILGNPDETVTVDDHCNSFKESDDTKITDENNIRTKTDLAEAETQGSSLGDDINNALSASIKPCTNKTVVSENSIHSDTIVRAEQILKKYRRRSKDCASLQQHLPAFGPGTNDSINKPELMKDKELTVTLSGDDNNKKCKKGKQSSAKPKRPQGGLKYSHCTKTACETSVEIDQSVKRPDLQNDGYASSTISNIIELERVDINIDLEMKQADDYFKTEEKTSQNVNVKKRKGRRSADKSTLGPLCERWADETTDCTGLVGEEMSGIGSIVGKTEEVINAGVKSNRRRSRRSKDTATLMAELKTVKNLHLEGEHTLGSGDHFDAAETGEQEGAKKKPVPRKRRKSADTALLKVKLQMEEDAGDSNDNVNDPIPMKKQKGRKTETSSEVESIYRNKNYVKPEEHKPWQTIFEQQDKFGELMGKKKMQRYVNFEKPTQMKLRRRQQKATKHGWNAISRKRKALDDDYVQDKLNTIWSELDNSSGDAPSLQEKLRKIVETD